MPHLTGAWGYVGFNAEYLFFPFSSSRSVAKLLASHTEKRRGYVLTYVVDLCAGDLNADPTGVNVGDARRLKLECGREYSSCCQFPVDCV